MDLVDKVDRVDGDGGRWRMTEYRWLAAALWWLVLRGLYRAWAALLVGI